MDKIKILYICTDEVDYMSNMLFNGLACLDFVEVTDSTKIWWMYDNIDIKDCENLYGKAFSLRKTLPDIPRDRENIEQKIKDHYYDFIIYGSIWRSRKYLDLVYKHYSGEEIIFIDGEDHNNIFTLDYRKKVLYFKRELVYSCDAYVSTSDYSNIYPISFAIPECRFNNCPDKPNLSIKQCLEQNNIVELNNLLKKDKYKFSTEEEYYQTYANSFFGITKKKCGWDCLRHYEILASGCIPYFENFTAMPKTIMHNWPIDLQIEANNLYYTFLWSHPDHIKNRAIKDYYNLYIRFIDYAKKHLTTKALAIYVLSKLHK